MAASLAETNRRVYFHFKEPSHWNCYVSLFPFTEAFVFCELIHKIQRLLCMGNGRAQLLCVLLSSLTECPVYPLERAINLSKS